MSRGVVYTAITGGKDVLRDPEVVMPGVDYVCFSDAPATSSIWRVAPLDRDDLDVVRRSRYPKLLPHIFLQPYAWSLWVDANFAIGDLTPLLDQRRRFGAFRHPKRTCVYEEGEACISLAKDDPAVIRKQLARYRQAGLPAGQGLAYGGVLFRCHRDLEVKEVMRAWWRELVRGSRRDQISLPYVLWKTGFKVDYFFDGEMTYRDFDGLKRLKHARP